MESDPSPGAWAPGQRVNRSDIGRSTESASADMSASSTARAPANALGEAHGASARHSIPTGGD